MQHYQHSMDSMGASVCWSTFFLINNILQSPVTHQADEIHESERDKLQEMWDASKCKTKLIAL